MYWSLIPGWYVSIGPVRGGLTPIAKVDLKVWAYQPGHKRSAIEKNLGQERVYLCTCMCTYGEEKQKGLQSIDL